MSKDDFSFSVRCAFRVRGVNHTLEKVIFTVAMNRLSALTLRKIIRRKSEGGSFDSARRK